MLHHGNSSPWMKANNAQNLVTEGQEENTYFKFAMKWLAGWRASHCLCFDNLVIKNEYNVVHGAQDTSSSVTESFETEVNIVPFLHHLKQGSLQVVFLVNMVMFNYTLYLILYPF